MALTLPTLPEKNFFNMGEVSRLCGVSPHTIRYWERHAGIPRPARRPSGHRRYEKKDLELVMRLKNLTQNGEMTLAGARKIILRESRGGFTATNGTSTTGQASNPNRAFSKALQELRAELKALINELSS